MKKQIQDAAVAIAQRMQTSLIGGKGFPLPELATRLPLRGATECPKGLVLIVFRKKNNLCVLCVLSEAGGELLRKDEYCCNTGFIEGKKGY